MLGSPLARAAEAPGRGTNWGMAAPSPTLPRGTRIKVGTVGLARADPVRPGPRDRRLGEPRRRAAPVDGRARRPDDPRDAGGRDGLRAVRPDRGQVLAAGPLSRSRDAPDRSLRPGRGPSPHRGARAVFEAAGGMPFFEALVGPVLRPASPRDPVLRRALPGDPDDLPARRRHRLTLFLAQYWGGPTTYDAASVAIPGCGCAIRRSRSVRRSATAGCGHMRTALATLDPPPEVAGRSSATSRWPPRRCATGD